MKTPKKLLIPLILLLTLPLFPQSFALVAPQEYDLVLKTGQEFSPNEASFFIDDIEAIKKSKFSSIVKISGSGTTYEIVVAERDSKKDAPTYFSYTVTWISDFKYNGVSYAPLRIFTNHFYLGKK